jgi:hypothetical protein
MTNVVTTIASAPPTPIQKRFVDHVGTSSFCGIVAIVVDPCVVVGPASPGMTKIVVVGPGFVVDVVDVVVPRGRVAVVRGRVVAVGGAVVAGDVVAGGSVRGGDVTGGSVAGGCVAGGWVAGGGVVTTCASAGAAAVATATSASAPARTASRTARIDADGTGRRDRRAITSVAETLLDLPIEHALDNGASPAGHAAVVVAQL